MSLDHFKSERFSLGICGQPEYRPTREVNKCAFQEELIAVASTKQGYIFGSYGAFVPDFD